MDEFFASLEDPQSPAALDALDKLAKSLSKDVVEEADRLFLHDIIARSNDLRQFFALWDSLSTVQQNEVRWAALFSSLSGILKHFHKTSHPRSIASKIATDILARLKSIYPTISCCNDKLVPASWRLLTTLTEFGKAQAQILATTFDFSFTPIVKSLVGWKFKANKSGAKSRNSIGREGKWRKCVVEFITAIVANGSADARKLIISNQAILMEWVNGLPYDQQDAVSKTIKTFKMVLYDTRINRHIKASLFSLRVLQTLQSINRDEVYDLLYDVCTLTIPRGIVLVFEDDNLTKNIIANFLAHIRFSSKKSRGFDLITRVLRRHSYFVSIFVDAFKPDFDLSKPNVDAEMWAAKLSVCSAYLQNTEHVAFPPTLSKSILVKALQCSNKTIQNAAVEFLNVAVMKDSNRVHKILPDPQVVIGLLRSCTQEQSKPIVVEAEVNIAATDAADNSSDDLMDVCELESKNHDLNHVIQLFANYVTKFPSAMHSTRFDYGKLLDLIPLYDSVPVQLTILKILSQVCHDWKWYNKQNGKSHLGFLLQLANTTKHKEIRDFMKDTMLPNILKSTYYFRYHPSESAIVCDLLLTSCYEFFEMVIVDNIKWQQKWAHNYVSFLKQFEHHKNPLVSFVLSCVILRKNTIDPYTLTNSLSPLHHPLLCEPAKTDEEFENSDHPTLPFSCFLLILLDKIKHMVCRQKSLPKDLLHVMRNYFTRLLTETQLIFDFVDQLFTGWCENLTSELEQQKEKFGVSDETIASVSNWKQLAEGLTNRVDLCDKTDFLKTWNRLSLGDSVIPQSVLPMIIQYAICRVASCENSPQELIVDVVEQNYTEDVGMSILCNPVLLAFLFEQSKRGSWFRFLVRKVCDEVSNCGQFFNFLNPITKQVHYTVLQVIHKKRKLDEESLEMALSVMGIMQEALLDSILDAALTSEMDEIASKFITVACLRCSPLNILHKKLERNLSLQHLNQIWSLQQNKSFCPMLCALLGSQLCRHKNDSEMIEFFQHHSILDILDEYGVFRFDEPTLFVVKQFYDFMMRSSKCICPDPFAMFVDGYARTIQFYLANLLSQLTKNADDVIRVFHLLLPPLKVSHPILTPACDAVIPSILIAMFSLTSLSEIHQSSLNNLVAEFMHTLSFQKLQLQTSDEILDSLHQLFTYFGGKDANLILAPAVYQILSKMKTSVPKTFAKAFETGMIVLTKEISQKGAWKTSNDPHETSEWWQLSNGAQAFGNWLLSLTQEVCSEISNDMICNDVLNTTLKHWKKFTTTCLKYRINDSRVMDLLRRSLFIISPNPAHVRILPLSTIFEMMLNHSQFNSCLEVPASDVSFVEKEFSCDLEPESSPFCQGSRFGHQKRNGVVALMHTLIFLDAKQSTPSSILKPSLLTVLFSIYQGSTLICDSLIEDIIWYVERKLGFSTAPWIISMFVANQNEAAKESELNIDMVADKIDSIWMMESLMHFDIDSACEPSQDGIKDRAFSSYSNTETHVPYYSFRFWFNIVNHIVAQQFPTVEQLVADKEVGSIKFSVEKLFSTNLVGLLIRGLSSTDEQTRILAHVSLNKIYQLLSAANLMREMEEKFRELQDDEESEKEEMQPAHKKQKFQVQESNPKWNEQTAVLRPFLSKFTERRQIFWLLHCLRSSLNGSEVTPRLMSLASCFYIYAIQAFLNPGDPLYQGFGRYLTRNPVFEVGDLFLDYLQSIDEKAWEEQRFFVMKLFVYGIRGDDDLYQVKRRRILTFLIANYHNPSTTSCTKYASLDVLKAMVRASRQSFPKTIPNLVALIHHGAPLLLQQAISGTKKNEAPTKEKFKLDGEYVRRTAILIFRAILDSFSYALSKETSEPKPDDVMEVDVQGEEDEKEGNEVQDPTGQKESRKTRLLEKIRILFASCIVAMNDVDDERLKTMVVEQWVALRNHFLEGEEFDRLVPLEMIRDI